MIGEFNRENPYVIQIMENIDPMKENALECTKLLIRTLILEGLMSITCAFSFFGIWPMFILILYLMATRILSRVSQWKMVVSTNPLEEVIRIVYGNEYEKIYVNNEKLLKLIEGIAAFKEKVRYLGMTFRAGVRISIFESVAFILARILFMIF